jgi:hypothetical protein
MEEGRDVRLITGRPLPRNHRETFLLRLDLWQSDERRLVLLVERNNVEHAEPLPAPTWISSPGWIMWA